MELDAGDDAARDQCGGGTFVGQLNRLVGEDFEVGRKTVPVARHLLPNATNRSDAYLISCLFYGGHSRIRTYDFHRVKVALYR